MVVGAASMGIVAWSSLWIYFVAELAGGAAAATVFKLVNTEDK